MHQKAPAKPFIHHCVMHCFVYLSFIVSRDIYHAVYPTKWLRAAYRFPKKSRSEFKVFWIRNVHETKNFTYILPERVSKQPIIHAVRIFYGPRTKTFVQTMRENGLIKIDDWPDIQRIDHWFANHILLGAEISAGTGC